MATKTAPFHWYDTCYVNVDQDGMFVSDRIEKARHSYIEHGRMDALRGIIVHQTGGSTAKSSLSSYQNAGANGAHFLIDKDGKVYQTASVFYSTWHVGKLKSRCMQEHVCSPIYLKEVKKLNLQGLHQKESKKSVPERYPSNADSIGIELVGIFVEKTKQYEAVTEAQNKSLTWLVQLISTTFGVPLSEVFRHPDVSYKQVSEAASANWKVSFP